MKKLIFLALLLSLGFFGVGCIQVPPANQTNTTTPVVNNPITNPVATATPKVVFFYDPQNGGIEDGLVAGVNAHLPAVTVEKKCTDFTLLMYNQSSQSSTICAQKDGAATFQNSMATLKSQVDKGAQSPIFVVSGDQYTQVMPSINPLLLSKAICAVNQFTGCSNLPNPSSLPTSVYVVNQSDSTQFAQIYSILNQSGVILVPSVQVVTSADQKNTLNAQTGANFLPIMKISNPTADDSFVLDMLLEQVNSAQGSPFAGKKVADGYIFYPTTGQPNYYIGKGSFMNAIVYAPADQLAKYEGLFEQLNSAGILLNVSYVSIVDAPANLANVSGQNFLPLLVIQGSSVNAAQKAALDAVVAKPLDLGNVVLSMKNVDGNYYGYTSMGDAALYFGPKLSNVTLDVYIMSHCPYGTQMQKALIPVIELFNGTGVLNVDNNFVSYTMHGDQEVTDNLIQQCMEMNYPNKTWPYIRCFVEKNGDSKTCLASLGVPQADMDACVASTKAKYGVSGTKFPVDAAENTAFGVQGSPTLVFQGRQLQLQRNAEAIKQFVCGMLANPPAACNTTLVYTANPGFGPINGTATGSTSTASCG